MKNEQIKTLAQLQDAASNRQSVICPAAICYSKPLPAAFVINLQGRTLHRLLERGLYIYTKRTKEQDQGARPMKNEDIKKLVDLGTWKEDRNRESGITEVHFSVCGIPFRAQYHQDVRIYAITVGGFIDGKEPINFMHELATKLREAE